MPEGTTPADGENKQPSTAEQQPEKKPEPAKAAPPPEKKDPPAAEAKTARELDGDSDEIPEDNDLFQLSKSALNKRLQRHTKRELRERFGSDDPEEIKAKLDRLADFEKKAEEERRASLSREEQLKEDLAREKKAREDAEKKAQRAQDQQVFAEYDRDASSAVGEVVKEKHVKRAIRELKEYVLTLDDEDLAEPSKVFSKWAKDFVKENPEFAREQGDPEPRKIPLSTGTDSRKKPEKGNVDMATKTPKPGQPNSMSKAEFQQYKRDRGLS